MVLVLIFTVLLLLSVSVFGRSIGLGTLVLTLFLLMLILLFLFGILYMRFGILTLRLWIFFNHECWLVYKSAMRLLMSTNHKDIANLYHFFVCFCTILFTVAINLNRMELVFPVNKIFWSNPNLPDLCFTNSEFFVFFFIMLPVYLGILGNGTTVTYLIQDKEIMAFPRMNRLAFWFLLPSLIFFVLSISVDNGTGWVVSPPLRSINSDEGLASFFAVLSLHFACISYILTSFNFLFTCIFALYRIKPFLSSFFIYFDGYNSSVIMLSIWLLLSLPLFILNPEVVLLYDIW